MVFAFFLSRHDALASFTTVQTIMSDASNENHSTATFAPVRAIMTIAREFDKLARELDVSIVQYRFMLYLKDGPKRAGEVAATSLVTKATISGHINALRDKGWVKVEMEPVDRRVTRLVLSAAGRKAMASFEAKLLECLGSLVHRDDRDRVLNHLREIYWALSATRDTRYVDLESPAYEFTPPSGGK